MIVAPDKTIDELFIKTFIAPRISAVLKKFDGPLLSTDKSKTKRPEYYPGYNKVCELYDQLKVHTDTTAFPSELFKERSPNMTASEYEYIKNNYKATTVPIWEDFINSLGRCWNDAGYDVKWSEQNDTIYKDENSTRYYTEKEIPVFGSVEAYFKEFYTPIKFQDANGAIGIVRKDLIYDDKEVVFSFIDNEVPKPDLEYYNCYQVVDPFNSNYFIVELHEKSDCKKGNNKKAGHIYMIYTKENIFLMYQTGDYDKYKFEVVLYYRHDLNYLPIRRNGGKPVLIENRVHYLSPFQFAVPNLDLALLNSSNLQLSINNVVYPVRVMVGNDCEFEDPEKGKCFEGFLEFNNQRTKCPSCHGTGLKSRLSPLGTILIKPKSSMNDSEIKPSEALYYVSPDVTSLTFLKDKILQDENRARGILHLKNNQEAAQGENPVESANAAQAYYAFIKPNSDQLFNTYQWALETMGKLREGDKFPGVEVTAPISFDFYSEQDYLTQIKEAISAQQPPFVIHTIIDNFLKRMFYADHESAKRYHLIMNADRLVTLSDNAISMGESKGIIAPWEVLLHQSGINLVGELEREDQEFWSKDMPEQIEALKDLAKLKADEIEGNDATQQMVDDKLSKLAPTESDAPITDDAVETPVDVEAEAKAKLKGSVGGVQGILEIQASVAAGITDYNAALTLLFEIFGFDDKTGRKLLGKPPVKKSVPQVNGQANK